MQRTIFMRLRSLVFIVWISATTAAWAQDSQPSPDPQASQDTQPQIIKPENPPEPEAHGTRLHWRDIPKNVLHDEKAIFTSPFHINRENAKWWIGFGAVTGALIANDQRISDTLPQKTVLTRSSTWASRLGADYSIYPLWGTFYLAGKAGNTPRARDTGRIGIEALIDADITVNILKLVTQRPRPENQGDKLAFFSGGDAFPSGHAIKTWALARVAAREFPDKKLVPILAYSAASAVSIARFGGRRHSASDVLAGSAMGFFIGDFVYRHHHAPSEKSNVLSWLSDHVDVGFNLGSNAPLPGTAMPNSFQRSLNY
jgi:membrane-associated phospholipid phosphatase